MLLSSMSARSIQVVAGVRVFFLFEVEYDSIMWMDTVAVVSKF